MAHWKRILTISVGALVILFTSAPGASPSPRNSLDNQGGPDAGGYIFVDNVAPDTCTYDWIELRGDAAATWINNWTTNHDDGYCTNKIPIGFSFPFYTASYDSFYATTNGQIEFGAPSAFGYDS